VHFIVLAGYYRKHNNEKGVTLTSKEVCKVIGERGKHGRQVPINTKVQMQFHMIGKGCEKAQHNTSM
jgi:hypothetical protein